MPTQTVPRTYLAEVATVFRVELRRFLCAPRTLWPAALYGVAGLGTAAVLRKGAETITAQAGEAGVTSDMLASQSAAMLGELLSFAGWGDADTAQAIVEARVPLPVLGFFVLASWFLPLLVAVVAFDRFSDLATGGARFALLRVRRESWFIGRWLSTAAAVSLLLGAMWGAAAVVLTGTGGASGIAVVREALRDALLMDLLALPYLGLTALVSSLARPQAAFVSTTFVWLALSTLSSALPLADPPWPWLRWLLPWSWAPNLIAREPAVLAAGVGGLVAIAAGLLLVSLVLLRRRDV
jgi:hypothetical protein